MKLLTSTETIQALLESKQIEYNYGNEKEWYKLKPFDFTIENLLDESYSFRLAQEMTVIGDVSFPKPETKPLVKGCAYYYVNPLIRELHTVTYWKNDEVDMLLLTRNLIHLTKENAIAHAKALVKLSGGSYE